eukprot:scaffold55981_cov78-Attheya_sp.AAC.2
MNGNMDDVNEKMQRISNLIAKSPKIWVQWLLVLTNKKSTIIICCGDLQVQEEQQEEQVL